jgi:hypothetical protein
VDVGVFAGIVALLLIFFRPGLLLSDSTMTGGDIGAHIYAPWYLREHLLPEGSLTGWSPGWFAGFPMLHFYFPLIATFQALLSYVIPYEVAFKLGTILGTFFLPASVYILFRLLRIGFPVPIVAALLSVRFLFMDSFSIYGGNIPSSMAGEYSFALSVGLCFVFLGLAYRLATEEEGRPLLAAVVLSLAVLSHLVPVIMVVLFLPVLVYWAVQNHGTKRAARRLGIPVAVAFGLTAFWSVPFLARLSYSANMRWTPLEGWGNLLPGEIWIYAAGAILAAVVGGLRRDRRVLIFFVPATTAIVLYFFLPQGHVWNGRFIPFWYLAAFLATAYVVGNAVPTIARAVWRRRSDLAAVVGVALLAIGSIGWSLWEKGSSFIDEWIDASYGGYESQSSYPKFDALMDRLSQLPPGRVMWEPDASLGEFGTPIALMSIPYWTDQPTMEGIYYESSITTPFHFLMAAELAQAPSNPIPDLPYSQFDLDQGIDHMELFDIRYFVTVTDLTQEAAVDSDRLRMIDTIGSLTLFEVESPGQVVVPRYEPVVLEGADWIEANLSWFVSNTADDVPLVRGGPNEWQRVSSFKSSLPRTELGNGGRSIDARVTDAEITFKTNAIGQPHWIKTSYFPNWNVEGAEGPFLASPSFMVVIPTQPDVHLSYERTWAEWIGLFLTLGTIGGLALASTRRRLVSIVNS